IAKLSSVAPSRPGLQIGHALRHDTDCFGVLYNTLGSSKQPRLIAKAPSSRVQLRLKSAAMLLALFQRHETRNEKQDHGAKTDKNYNGDYSDRPFKYRSSFHSLATDEHRPNTDYKPCNAVA